VVARPIVHDECALALALNPANSHENDPELNNKVFLLDIRMRAAAHENDPELNNRAPRKIPLAKSPRI
jgi:hypothetical protein